MNFMPCNNYNMCKFCYLDGCNYNMYNDLRYPKENYCKCDTKSVPLNNQNLKPKNFKLTYPFVGNISNKNIQNMVNKAVVDEVSKLFKKSVLVPEEINFEEVLGFYDLKLNEKCLLSILFDIYTFAGGAHGYTTYSSLTMDLDTGEIYDLNDLFNSKINYKPILENKVREYIKENNVPLIEEYKGLSENQQFYITPKSLVLYYQVYEYTPYAYGLFKIEIPFKDIMNLLGPVSPIQRLFC